MLVSIISSCQKWPPASSAFASGREKISPAGRVLQEALICISEAWTATIQQGQPFQHAAEVPNRGEALHLIAASEDGGGFAFSAPFTRVGEEIVIHETEDCGLDYINSIAPVLSAWKEMAAARRIGG